MPFAKNETKFTINELGHYLRIGHYRSSIDKARDILKCFLSHTLFEGDCSQVDRRRGVCRTCDWRGQCVQPAHLTLCSATIADRSGLIRAENVQITIRGDRRAASCMSAYDLPSRRPFQACHRA